MIIFSFWILFTQSANFHNITQLTSNNWNKEIEHRKNGTVYFVMFHGDHCPACRMTYPIFQEAADIADGMIKFGNVDTSREPYIASRFHILSIPTFIIFHHDGDTQYSGPRAAKKMVQYASKFIQNVSIPIDQTWLPKDGFKAAILFTSKSSSLTLWNALASYFDSTGIQFGFSSDPQMMEQYDIAFGPAIVFINGESQIKYMGQMSFSSIQKSIKETFPNCDPTSKPPSKNNILLSGVTKLRTKEDFESYCKGKGFFCIIQGGEEPEPGFKHAANLYKNDPFKFFTCGTDCEFKQYKEGLHIIHPRRNAHIDISSMDELSSTIDHVIDGGARWKNEPKTDL